MFHIFASSEIRDRLIGTWRPDSSQKGGFLKFVQIGVLAVMLILGWLSFVGMASNLQEDDQRLRAAIIYLKSGEKITSLRKYPVDIIRVRPGKSTEGTGDRLHRPVQVEVVALDKVLEKLRSKGFQIKIMSEAGIDRLEENNYQESESEK